VLAHPAATSTTANHKELAIMATTKNSSTEADAMQQVETTEVFARPRFQRAFTIEQVEQAERDYNTTHGINRRVVQVILTKSSGELLKMVREMAKDDEGANNIFGMVDRLSAYEDHLKVALDLTKAAHARLLSCAGYLADGHALAAASNQGAGQ
jgi:hypothetical protein